MSSKECCGDCKYFSRNNCYLKPPVVLLDSYSSVHNLLPRVIKTDFCSFFIPKEKESLKVRKIDFKKLIL